MTNNFRVFNLTLHVWIKHRQAQKAVENCAAAWVDPRTIRQLTLAEAIAARNEQAKTRALSETVFGGVEIPGLKFIPPLTTTYCAPRAAIEGMTYPLMARKCRWPRMVSPS